MNGMAQHSWPYVIAAYVVTWTVLGAYALYLWRTVKDAFARISDSSSR
jgi:CcmD family protein